MANIPTRRNSYLAWACVGLTLAFHIAGAALIGATPRHLIPADLERAISGWWANLSILYTLAFTIVGALIIARRPGNRVGWVAIGIGISTSLYTFITGYNTFGTLVDRGLPALGFVNSLSNWEWAVPVTLALFFLPLLFPDGRPVSPWWWLALPVVVLGYVAAFAGIPAGQYVAMAANLAANFTLIIRFRQASPDVRQQIRWFVFALLVVIVVSVAGVVVGSLVYHNNTVVFNPYFDVLIPLAFTFLAISIGVAVMKYHLYDIDVFIRQGLVYGTLIVLISIVYFIVVVGVASHLWGVRAGDPGGAVAVGAIIALVFQPLRRFLARLANRLVYGKRATPYEVLSQFSHQVGGMVATDQISQRMAQVLAQGTGADLATVWLHVGRELRPAASWPAGVNGYRPIRLQDGALPLIDNVSEAVPVQYQGELLGALTVRKREPMTQTERRLLADLAQESGLVLKNARLTAELVERLDQLQASRERLITAQDTARRQLERNIHDGAQQNLVALKVKIALAKRLATTDPARAQAMLDELTGETDEAIETLRELARGLYPPLLAQEGLVAAVQAQARRTSIPVEVVADRLPRYPQETEASVYFCVLEALQNIVKHAGASKACVHLEPAEGRLSFSISDDGHGFDPAKQPEGSGMQNMRDRVEVLGGRLQVESSPGAGTRICGSVPVAESQVAESRSGSNRDLGM
jgi:signal transduction histidine kinase